MQQPTKPDIASKYDKRLQSLLGHMTIQLVEQNTVSRKLACEGVRLLDEIRKEVIDYAKKPHRAGTFMLVDGEGLQSGDLAKVNGYMHIGSKTGAPLQLVMKDAYVWSRVLGVDFVIVDPMDALISDDCFQRMMVLMAVATVGTHVDKVTQ